MTIDHHVKGKERTRFMDTNGKLFEVTTKAQTSNVQILIDDIIHHSSASSTDVSSRPG